MPTGQGDVIETAINWDHDAGLISVCTRRKAIVTKLKGLGFTPKREELGGYVCFEVSDQDLKVSLTRPRKATEGVLRALQKARKAASDGA